MGLISSLVSLLLPSILFGQTPPDWTVDYQLNGLTVVDTTSPTSHVETPWDIDPTQWRSACSIGGTLGTVRGAGSVTGTCAGSVTVRVRWTGSGTAPNHLWLKVDSAASWAGDSGNCSNGQEDPKVAISPGPGETSTGKHIIRKAYSGQPITFTVALSSNMSCATSGRAYKIAAGLVVSVTDRSAILARGDGGTSTLVGDTYTGHTLLSWSGTHDGLNYDNLPDGGPGLTSQTLTGTASGAWSTKQFTNPQTQQPYTTSDLTIAWGGSTTGAVSLTPPNPLSVLATTYQGNMPQFDPEGTSPKEETWTYKVKDNQDGSVIDLKWKWVAHYAHENWQPIAPPNPNQPETQYIAGDTLATGLPFDDDHKNFSVIYRQKVSIEVETIYGGSTSLQLPFNIQKHHIGIGSVRPEYGNTRLLEEGLNNHDNYWEGTWNGIIPGNYDVIAVAYADKFRGYVDIWNKKGEKGLGNMTFVPASSFNLKAITSDELGAQN